MCATKHSVPPCWRGAQRAVYNSGRESRRSRGRAVRSKGGEDSMPLELTREREARATTAPKGTGVTLARRRLSPFTALDLAMAGSVLISVAGNIVSAKLAVGWYTAVALDLIQATYLLALAIHLAWRGLLGRLFLAGLVAGTIELFTDAAGEYVVRSLSYPPEVPLLWASPIYMPLAWALVLTQLGYLGWRLRGL